MTKSDIPELSSKDKNETMDDFIKNGVAKFKEMDAGGSKAHVIDIVIALDAKVKTQEKVMDALYHMLRTSDVWTECDDCLEVWASCSLHKECKIFFNTNTLDEFVKAIMEADDGT